MKCYRINTMLCFLKVSSNTIELSLHTSCCSIQTYCMLQWLPLNNQHYLQMIPIASISDISLHEHLFKVVKSFLVALEHGHVVMVVGYTCVLGVSTHVNNFAAFCCEQFWGKHGQWQVTLDHTWRWKLKEKLLNFLFL